MSEPLSVSQALLSATPPVTDTTWTEAFDRVLKDVLQQCRPGYVELPTDAVHHKVSKSGLSHPPVSHFRGQQQLIVSPIPIPLRHLRTLIRNLLPIPLPYTLLSRARPLVPLPTK